jgi:hypothetical protein
MVKTYDIKIIKSGHIIEIMQYKNKILSGYEDKNKNSGRTAGNTEKTKEDDRLKTMRQAKQKIRRTINANATDISKFITLTFKENMTDLTQANNEFKKFIKRMNYETKLKLQYTWVIEFQKRGAIHYHMIFYNLPYMPNKRLAEIWGNGFIKINKIDSVDNLGSYVVKYMTKTDDERLHKRKCYGNSKNLKIPIEIKKDSRDGNPDYLPNIEPTYQSIHENEHQTVVYTQYNTKRYTNANTK